MGLKRSIGAVIVTYHPSAQMHDNILNVVSQVEGLVVVDNGSASDEVERLRLASRTLGFALIENEENLGIAFALNQGVFWARSMSYSWVVFFDQDSKITADFITQMFTDWEAHPARDLVGSLHPCYIEPNQAIEPIVRRARDGGPVTSMTSGALMPMWIFDRLGLFATDYFIDLVDCEYCFRIRAAGFLVADSRRAVLLHAAGEPRQASFLGFSCRPSHHSATRRYYISRNRVVVYRSYFRVFPRWILYSIYEASRETAKCLLVEDDRARKLLSVLIGTWDGMTGRMGKRL